ncbi:MAG: copper resistance protein CopC [Acetobacteraceae bacterium]|nr:copper resistance protein CopC [Acetobacteraceae bacterium]
MTTTVRKKHMPLRCRLLPLLLAAGLIAAPAAAEPMRVLAVSPSAHSVMDGARQELSVRFDGPVDHHRSRLLILRGDQVVRDLAPRLGASPDTLYAVAGGLPAGAYTLRWVARTARDGATSEGQLEFTVR